MAKQKAKTRLSVWIPLLLFGVIIGILMGHVFNPARSARMELLRKDHDRLRMVVEELKRDNNALTKELQSLEEGTEGWRDVARKEFGLLAPGEVLFRFPANDNERPLPNLGR